MNTAILRSRILDLAISGKLTNSNTEEWETMQVGKVAEYVNGRAFKPEEWETTGLPIIRIQNLNNNEAAFNYSTAHYEDKYLIHNGDLLFAWAASLGVYIWNKGEAWLNQHIFRVLPYDFMDKKFLYYVLQNLIREFYTLTHGSGMVHITKDKFENYQIQVPPLPEQRRIVAKVEELLGEVDKIEQAQTDITHAATILRSRVIDMAIRGQLVPQDPNEGTAMDLLKEIAHQRGKAIIPITDNVPFSIPDNWCWVKFNDYIDVRDGTHDTPKYVEKGIPFVTSKNLVKGNIDFSSCKFITNDDYENFNKRSNVEDQDILYAMIGTIGNPVIVKKDRDFAIKNVALFKKRISNTNMFYIYYLLMGMEKQFRSDATGGLQPFVSLKMFREAFIPLPPLPEQHRIVAKVEELFAEIDKLIN